MEASSSSSTTTPASPQTTTPLYDRASSESRLPLWPDGGDGAAEDDVKCEVKILREVARTAATAGRRRSSAAVNNTANINTATTADDHAAVDLSPDNKLPMYRRKRVTVAEVVGEVGISSGEEEERGGTEEEEAELLPLSPFTSRSNASSTAAAAASPTTTIAVTPYLSNLYKDYLNRQHYHHYYRQQQQHQEQRTGAPPTAAAMATLQEDMAAEAKMMSRLFAALCCSCGDDGYAAAAAAHHLMMSAEEIVTELTTSEEARLSATIKHEKGLRALDRIVPFWCPATTSGNSNSKQRPQPQFVPVRSITTIRRNQQRTHQKEQEEQREIHHANTTNDGDGNNSNIDEDSKSHRFPFGIVFADSVQEEEEEAEEENVPQEQQQQPLLPSYPYDLRHDLPPSAKQQQQQLQLQQGLQKQQRIATMDPTGHSYYRPHQPNDDNPIDGGGSSSGGISGGGGGGLFLHVWSSHEAGRRYTKGMQRLKDAVAIQQQQQQVQGSSSATQTTGGDDDVGVGVGPLLSPLPVHVSAVRRVSTSPHRTNNSSPLMMEGDTDDQDCCGDRQGDRHNNNRYHCPEVIPIEYKGFYITVMQIVPIATIISSTPTTSSTTTINSGNLHLHEPQRQWSAFERRVAKSLAGVFFSAVGDSSTPQPPPRGGVAATSSSSIDQTPTNTPPPPPGGGGGGPRQQPPSFQLHTVVPPPPPPPTAGITSSSSSHSTYNAFHRHEHPAALHRYRYLLKRKTPTSHHHNDEDEDHNVNHFLVLSAGGCFVGHSDVPQAAGTTPSARRDSSSATTVSMDVATTATTTTSSSSSSSSSSFFMTNLPINIVPTPSSSSVVVTSSSSPSSFPHATTTATRSSSSGGGLQLGMKVPIKPTFLRPEAFPFIFEWSAATQRKSLSPTLTTTEETTEKTTDKNKEDHNNSCAAAVLHIRPVASEVYQEPPPPPAAAAAAGANSTLGEVNNNTTIALGVASAAGATPHHQSFSTPSHSQQQQRLGIFSNPSPYHLAVSRYLNKMVDPTKAKMVERRRRIKVGEEEEEEVSSHYYSDDGKSSSSAAADDDRGDHQQVDVMMVVAASTERAALNKESPADRNSSISRSEQQQHQQQQVEIPLCKALVLSHVAPLAVLGMAREIEAYVKCGGAATETARDNLVLHLCNTSLVTKYLHAVGVNCAMLYNVHHICTLMIEENQERVKAATAQNDTQRKNASSSLLAVLRVVRDLLVFEMVIRTFKVLMRAELTTGCNREKIHQNRRHLASASAGNASDHPKQQQQRQEEEERVVIIQHRIQVEKCNRFMTLASVNDLAFWKDFASVVRRKFQCPASFRLTHTNHPVLLKAIVLRVFDSRSSLLPPTTTTVQPGPLTTMPRRLMILPHHDASSSSVMGAVFSHVEARFHRMVPTTTTIPAVSQPPTLQQLPHPYDHDLDAQRLYGGTGRHGIAAAAAAAAAGGGGMARLFHSGSVISTITLARIPLRTPSCTSPTVITEGRRGGCYDDDEEDDDTTRWCSISATLPDEIAMIPKEFALHFVGRLVDTSIQQLLLLATSSTTAAATHQSTTDVKEAENRKLNDETRKKVMTLRLACERIRWLLTYWVIKGLLTSKLKMQERKTTYKYKKTEIP